MATIKDIAREAGVSAMTVSRYFNEPDKLKDKTYDKIKEVVERMDYQPNMMARLLATRKTNIICMFISGDIDWLHPFSLQTIAGVGETLGKNGYSMMLVHDNIEKQVCDGIIATGLSIEEEDMLSNLSDEKAIIIFGNRSKNSNWVDINNYKGVYDSTQYMIDRGYKKIGYIGIDNDQGYPIERHNGYLDCMRDNNMQVPINGDVKVPNHEDDGYDGATMIFENSDVDGIVCASDALALGVMRYANEKGIDVPGDIGVIGYDGLGYEKLVTPNLTTMRQPVYEAGQALAKRMIETLQSGEYAGKEFFIDPILQVGGTTK